MQVSRGFQSPVWPPQTIKTPERRERLWPSLGWGRSGMVQLLEGGRGNISTLERTLLPSEPPTRTCPDLLFIVSELDFSQLFPKSKVYCQALPTEKIWSKLTSENKSCFNGPVSWSEVCGWMDLASKSNKAICNETCIIRNGQKQMKNLFDATWKIYFYKYWFL